MRLVELCRPDRVLHQHCDSHRSYASGNGSYGSGNFFGALKLHVAAELFVFEAVYAYVYYYRALLYHIARDKIRDAHRHNEYIGLFCMLLKVLCARVAYRDLSLIHI